MIEFDFNTVTIGEHTGYGNASKSLVGAMERQGSKYTPGASVMLNFCMPDAYKYSEYTIGYTPWESTQVPESWVHGINEVDELWSTSTWTAKVLSHYRGEFVRVYPHGIDPIWTPRARGWARRPFIFLHVGEPAIRKGGDILLEAWHKGFKDRRDVKLIFKAYKFVTARVKDDSGSIISSPGLFDNVEVKGKILSQPELVELYHSANCMVYPTRGEGFGLIPLEAMASGMPTIFPQQGGTGDFAEYSDHVLRNSLWVSSSVPTMHPGLWLDHDVDELIYLMNNIMNTYKEAAEIAYQQAHIIHYEYSWDEIARRVVDRLREISE